MLYKKEITSPLGNLIALATDEGLCLLEFADNQHIERELQQVVAALKEEITEKDNPIILLLEKELEDYFKGELKHFSVPLHLVGTDFQKRAWQALVQIPYGKTISYKAQAEQMLHPKAVRAVANANGGNKIVILVPCHRVVGSNGKLTGYSSGVWRKEKLLLLESDK